MKKKQKTAVKKSVKKTQTKEVRKTSLRGNKNKRRTPRNFNYFSYRPLELKKIFGNEIKNSEKKPILRRINNKIRTLKVFSRFLNEIHDIDRKKLSEFNRQSSFVKYILKHPEDKFQLPLGFFPQVRGKELDEIPDRNLIERYASRSRKQPNRLVEPEDYFPLKKDDMFDEITSLERQKEGKAPLKMSEEELDLTHYFKYIKSYMVDFFIRRQNNLYEREYSYGDLPLLAELDIVFNRLHVKLQPDSNLSLRKKTIPATLTSTKRFLQWKRSRDFIQTRNNFIDDISKEIERSDPPMDHLKINAEIFKKDYNSIETFFNKPKFRYYHLVIQFYSIFKNYELLYEWYDTFFDDICDGINKKHRKGLLFDQKAIKESIFSASNAGFTFIKIDDNLIEKSKSKIQYYSVYDPITLKENLNQHQYQLGLPSKATQHHYNQKTMKVVEGMIDAATPMLESKLMPLHAVLDWKRDNNLKKKNLKKGRIIVFLSSGELSHWGYLTGKDKRYKDGTVYKIVKSKTRPGNLYKIHMNDEGERWFAVDEKEPIKINETNKNVYKNEYLYNFFNNISAFDFLISFSRQSKALIENLFLFFNHDPKAELLEDFRKLYKRIDHKTGRTLGSILSERNKILERLIVQYPNVTKESLLDSGVLFNEDEYDNLTDKEKDDLMLVVMKGIKTKVERMAKETENYVEYIEMQMRGFLTGSLLDIQSGTVDDIIKIINNRLNEFDDNEINLSTIPKKQIFDLDELKKITKSQLQTKEGEDFYIDTPFDKISMREIFSNLIKNSVEHCYRKNPKLSIDIKINFRFSSELSKENAFAIFDDKSLIIPEAKEAIDFGDYDNMDEINKLLGGGSDGWGDSNYFLFISYFNNAEEDIAMTEEDFFKEGVKGDESEGKGIGMSELKTFVKKYGGNAYLDEKCEERLGKKGFRLMMAIPCKLRPSNDIDIDLDETYLLKKDY